MKTKLIFLMILLVLFTIFVSQNTEETNVNIFFWQISMAKIILLIISLALGVIIGLITATLINRKEKKKQREKDKVKLQDSGEMKPEKGMDIK